MALDRVSGARGVFLLGAALGVLLVSCGGSGGDGAAALAKQQELQAAREQAAQDARQSARISELERKLKRAHRKRQEAPAGGGSGEAAVSASAEGDAEAPSLVGLWKGEAVIEYESGEADPFNETIEISSLSPGEVSGYGEAHQGSTTCHGPLTLEEASGGSYRFSAVERNVAECIDYSEVELTLSGPETVSYRETTDVSVSTGTLTRVR